MHADGYAGFEELYRSGRIHEGACRSHIRRKFVEQARGQPPDQLVKFRQEKATTAWLAIALGGDPRTNTNTRPVDTVKIGPVFTSPI
jgi:hypothetical protein